MVGRVRKPRGVVPVDDSAIGEGVDWGAEAKVVGAAPGRRVGIDDHLAVSGDIGGHVTVARPTVVLPAAADVGQVELAVGTPTLYHVEG